MKTPKIAVFVSHRWETDIHPDPRGDQRHIVLRFLVEAVALSKGVCERFFSYAEPEIVLNTRLREQIQAHRTDLSWMNSGSNDADLYYDRRTASHKNLTPLLLARWLAESFPFLSFTNEELIMIGNVLDDVGIWYDYTCMPQRPFLSADERFYFDWFLSRMAAIIPSSNTLIIWDKQATDRAWCLLEGVIAELSAATSYDATPNTSWKLAVFQLQQASAKVHPNLQIASFLRAFAATLAGKTPDEILRFFTEHQIVCRHEEDLVAVARILSSHLIRAR